MEFLYLLYLLSFFVFLFLYKITYKPNDTRMPKSYPLIGHMFALYRNKGRTAMFRWLCDLINASPTSTVIIHRPFGERIVMTSDPKNVEHVLKTKFHIYEKGSIFKTHLTDLLGNGIFNVDGEDWKWQRRTASHEFSTKSLRKFIENVVDREISERLMPILHDAALTGKVIDLQDMLKRFMFDNICRIGFGYDLEYLTPSFPRAKFAEAFDDALMLSTLRFRTPFPILWKLQRFLNVGPEKRLRQAVSELRELADTIVQSKKYDMLENSLSEHEDLLSRFLKPGRLDDKTVVDIVISFILGGRDSSSAALTWFFWLLHKNKEEEDAILKEIQNAEKKTKQTADNFTVFDEVKEMVYTHASLCESMRLYPPIPADTKQAATDDVLPDGTRVEKGMRVSFFPYVMGRSKRIWGSNWGEFRPKRWLKEATDDAGDTKWVFMPYDPYSYTVFQAGPRTCLGKDMAFLQMKSVVAAVLSKFRVVPVRVEEGFEPVYVPNIIAKMKDGFPVRIVKRV